MHKNLAVTAVAILTFSLTSFPLLVAAEETAPAPEMEMDDDSGNNFGSRDDLVDYLSQSADGDAVEAQERIDDINASLVELNMDDAEATAALEDLNAGKDLLAEGQEDLASAKDKLAAATTPTEIADAEAEIEQANMKISAAESQIDGAIEVLASNPENEMLLGDLGAAETDLANAEMSASDIAAIVEKMSDEQVYWTNQKFQNAKASGLVVTIPLEELEKFTEYNFHQVSSATKAFEAEAKFTGLADKFDEDSKQHEMFKEKSETQRDKFLAKVERFEDDKFDSKKVAKDEAVGVAKSEAKLAAKREAGGAARAAAKNSAKDDAKSMAKANAKDSTKGIAKATAKLAAKDAAKQAAKNSAKQTAKQIVQEEGKALAKGKAKEAGKNAAKDNAKDKAKGKG